MKRLPEQIFKSKLKWRIKNALEERIKEDKLNPNCLCE